MIHVRNLTRRFGDVVAVDDISFDVDHGQIVGFLGPNGAGKTTTIRILTGYLPATQGTARVADHDVLRESLAVRRTIGYLPENVPLYPEMRVEEYLTFRIRLKERPRSETSAEADRVMEQCGLLHMRRRLVGHLSKGYRQRVGLADALIGQPPILILDEPTGGLDPHQRQEVLDLIRRLAETHTILLSSHVLAEVEAISTRVMIIQQGKLLAQGKVSELAGQLQEEPRVRAEVGGSEEAVRRVLDGCTGLKAAELAPLEEGWVAVRAKVATGEGVDGREELAARTAEAGLKLRELTREELSLQELFLRITAQAAAGVPSSELAEAAP